MTIAIGTLVLGFLVFIHEGGHFLAARAFGVRVTEFMIGLPGPSVGFTWKGTRFGVTAIPLGGYAAVCGMGTGKSSPHLKRVLGYMYEVGTADMEDVANALGISDDAAEDALDELCEWGCLKRPRRSDKHNTYRTTAVKLSENQRASIERSFAKKEERRCKKLARKAPEGNASAAQGPESAICTPFILLPNHEEGEACPIENIDAYFAQEQRMQYCNLPFWKRSVVLLAGPGMNLLFAMVVFVIIYSCIGVNLQLPSGEMVHRVLPPLDAIVAGFKYIGMVAMAILGLFNPQTAAQTVSNSTSIVGIAVYSKMAAEAGFISLLSFSAIISVSLGLANLLPIPPLDGGRFVVEIYQKVARRSISPRVLNYLSVAGICLFAAFFIFMVNQDVQRFILGNWS